MQMVDYAKKAIGNKLEADKIQASEAAKFKTNSTLASTNDVIGEKKKEKQGLKRKFDKIENVTTTVLQQSLKKTAAKLCLDNKIDYIAPPIIILYVQKMSSIGHVH